MRVGPEKPTRNIGGEINEPMKRDPIRRRGQTRLNMKAERIPPHGIPAARLHSPHAAEALQSLIDFPTDSLRRKSKRWKGSDSHGGANSVSRLSGRHSWSGQPAKFLSWLSLRDLDAFKNRRMRRE
jgi:hypothetical protein